MRELKFRAWDKIEQRFIFPDKGYQGHYVLSLNGRFHNLQNGSGGDECVVQQYAGLKDRKGVEVYEGDIVVEKITEEMAANGDSAIIGKVYFAAGTFMIDGDGPLYNHVHSLSPDVLEDFIVAGNMFQTPELLK
jgi:uncharacterized phage protein (TIGR01671 family)